MKDAENTIKNKREVRMSSRQKLETLWNSQLNELLAKKKNNNEAKKETNEAIEKYKVQSAQGLALLHADCRYSACKSNGWTVWHDTEGGVSGLFAKVFIVGGACTKAL